jgi:hypothetical protein
MSKTGRNKVPPAAYNQVQPPIPLQSKLPPLTKARIIAIGITVKLLKNVVNRLRGLSG